MVELGLTNAESGCSLWSHSSESQTPAMALHRRQKNFKYCRISIYTFLPLPFLPLTIMGGGDVDTFTGRFLAAELRHPVERLDCKDVRGVRQQAPHLQPAIKQAVLRGPVADAVSTGDARPLG